MSDSADRPDGRRIFAVSDLLAELAGLVAERVGRVWVVGELGNLHRARSGHVYFTLKDEGGQIRAALFRGAARRVLFELEEGLEVLAYAEVSIYAARGDLQLIVRQLEPRGQGALQLAFEQLRRRLEAEGLFARERKRALPPFPRRLGIVTSPTGAAVRDIIQVSGARFPATPLLVAPTRVQGEGAEFELAAAIEAVSVQPDVDVVLLARGGGSLEDLWAFNSEIVARAIAACPLPVVSGVGHETDVTIADLVADVRAPTPSAAAAVALPDRLALRRQLQRDWRRLSAAARTQFARVARRLERERDALRALSPTAQLAARRARFEVAAQALTREMRALVERRRAALGRLAAGLESLSPLAVLARGYALVTRAADGAIVRRLEEAPAGESLDIRLARARLVARVERGEVLPEAATDLLSNSQVE